jgi:predicted metal-dependent hydrolase
MAVSLFKQDEIMKLRMVPKEVFEVMDLNGQFNYHWSPDAVFSLVGLGTSYLLEFFEFYGDAISKYYDRFVKNTAFEDDRFHTFISQERRHAAAHKMLNLFMTKKYLPPAREKYHPRVYDFMYPTYKEFVEPIIAGIEEDAAKGMTLDSPHFREALKSIAIFETEVCMAAFSFFENLFDKGKITHIINQSQNLGVLYLFGYHYAEEMEHCHVSIETYETIYGEKLWTQKEVDNYLNNADILTRRIINATLFVARELGAEVSVRQIAFRLPAKNRMVAVGFNANDPQINSRIHYFVEKWDSEWEPLLRAKIHEEIKRRQVA